MVAPDRTDPPAPTSGAPRHLVSRSPAATQALGRALGRAARPGWILAIEGDLGAGKTCLVRGLAEGLEIEGQVSSPTYTLVASHQGRLELLHFDAWMEGRERALLADGGAEELGGEAVCAIEWADRVADVLPTPRLRLRLAHLSEHERSIELSVVGEDREMERTLREALPLGPELLEAPPAGASGGTERRGAP